MIFSVQTAACPRCKSERVYRSHRRTWSDHLLSRMGGALRRCHDCRDRHVVFRYAAFALGPKKVNAERLAALAFTAAMALCAIAAWLVLRRLNIPAG